MIGPEKLTTIRKRVRESYKMTDAELLAYFNARIEEASRKTEDNERVIESLRMFRDALIEETKRPKRARQVRSKVRNPK